jgi:DNA-binding MurR/RpiR family transcriptional regulator
LTMARRSNIDWDAIERDYRIGKLTLREMAAKHGVAESSVSLKAKQLGWTRDLTETVKQATKAALIEASKRRAEEIGVELGEKSARETEGAIKAAVSENVAIVMSHRRRLGELAAAVDEAKAKLLELGPQALDVREAAVFVQAVGNLVLQPGFEECGLLRGELKAAPPAARLAAPLGTPPS